jgi:hypothetical protein
VLKLPGAAKIESKFTGCSLGLGFTLIAPRNNTMSFGRG